jgi:hypothetical protein
MIDARTQRSEDLFYSALAVKCPGECRRFLDAGCAGDSDLFAMVEKMLASQVEVERFFRDSLPALRPTAEMCALFTTAGQSGTDAAAKLPEGLETRKRIGPYKLLQKSGRAKFTWPNRKCRGGGRWR